MLNHPVEAHPLGSPLIGRERELTAACDALCGAVQVLTLTGPGGSGKTRLSIEVAEQASHALGAPPVFVDLAPVTEPDRVPAVIARELGLPEGDAPLAQIKRSFRDAKKLLILDNFEHLLSAATAVAELAHTCTSMKFLVTSRAPLRIRGEHELPVGPLALPSATPGDGITPELFETIAASPAVQLFCQRAAAVDYTFALDETNAAAVARICQRLDGLPLAIELAATRVRVLSPQDLLERLSDRLSLLTSGPRDLPPRHQALASTIAWSYELLSPQEQALFRGMGVFAGAARIEGIAAVCCDDGVRDLDVIEMLAGLVEKNLIVRVPGHQGRFSMLETMREFALAELRACGELELRRERLATYVASLCNEASDHHMAGSRWSGLERLEEEYDNLRSALTWAIENDRADLAMAMTSTWVWYELHYNEGLSLTRSVLALPSAQEPSAARSRTLFSATCAAAAVGDLELVRQLSEENIALCRKLGDPELLAFALSLLGGSGDHSPEDLAEIYDEALALARQIGSDWLIAKLHMNQAMAALRMGDAQAAVEPASLAVREFEALDDAWMGAISSVHVGIALVQLGRHDEARPHLDRCALVFEAMRDAGFLIFALIGLGIVATEAGDVSAAARHFARAIRLCCDMGDLGRLPVVLDGIAVIAAAAGRHEAIEQLLADADYVRRSGKRPAAIWLARWAEESTRRLRARCNPGALPARPDVTQMIYDAAVLADSLAGPAKPATSPVAGLSARESEVLRLLAEGRSNRGIAETLVLSVRTVEKHIANIYAKIGARGRVDAASFAVRNGLIQG